MPSKSREKGRALENAVRVIQRAILESDSSLRGTKFSIESNKVVKVSGVRHELDVWVKTLAASHYESSWIFECKNWRKAVGKNDVIVLAEKVAALGANRGFLVARKFSKDAHAQVEQDKRLCLVHCAEDFASPFDFEVSHAALSPETISVSFRQRGVPLPSVPKTIDWKNERFALDGVPTRFDEFIRSHVDRMAEDEKRENASKYQLEGEHSGRRACKIEFEASECSVGDADMEWLVIELSFRVLVKKPKIISRFEVKGQGSAYSFESLQDIIPGKRLEIDVVFLPSISGVSQRS